LNVYSQQLTRFAVVDLPRVYTAFFRDSRAVRQFEERSARVQNDIDRITREIQELRSRHADAVLRNDETEALRLETQLHRRSEFLRDFYQTRTAELEAERRRLMQSGSFLDQVYDEIRLIAESEGFSLVLNLAENRGIIWHSPTVDITDRVISNLLTKAGN
jgi:outer membrane protein